jgi:hypothetical protein
MNDEPADVPYVIVITFCIISTTAQIKWLSDGGFFIGLKYYIPNIKFLRGFGN